MSKPRTLSLFDINIFFSGPGGTGDKNASQTRSVFSQGDKWLVTYPAVASFRISGENPLLIDVLTSVYQEVPQIIASFEQDVIIDRIISLAPSFPSGKTPKRYIDELVKSVKLVFVGNENLNTFEHGATPPSANEISMFVLWNTCEGSPRMEMWQILRIGFLLHILKKLEDQDTKSKTDELLSIASGGVLPQDGSLISGDSGISNVVLESAGVSIAVTADHRDDGFFDQGKPTSSQLEREESVVGDKGIARLRTAVPEDDSHIHGMLKPEREPLFAGMAGILKQYRVAVASSIVGLLVLLIAIVGFHLTRVKDNVHDFTTVREHTERVAKVSPTPMPKQAQTPEVTVSQVASVPEMAEQNASSDKTVASVALAIEVPSVPVKTVQKPKSVARTENIESPKQKILKVDSSAGLVTINIVPAGIHACRNMTCNEKVPIITATKDLVCREVGAVLLSNEKVCID
jgi:hypothetical protein